MDAALRELRRGAPGGLPLPWESPALSAVLGPRSTTPSRILFPPAPIGPAPPLPAPPDRVDPPISRAPGSGRQGDTRDAFVKAAVRGDPSCEEIVEDLRRRKALMKWSCILDLAGPDAALLCGQLRGAPLDDGDRIIKDVFAPKATDTLLKRAGSIFLYVKWAKGVLVAPFPISEQKAYDYAKYLNDGLFPATRATSF